MARSDAPERGSDLYAAGVGAIVEEEVEEEACAGERGPTTEACVWSCDDGGLSGGLMGRCTLGPGRLPASALFFIHSSAAS